MYKEDYNSKRLILDDVCLVDIPNPISKNNSSYVHIKQSNFKANARNSTSLRCVFNISLISPREINVLNKTLESRTKFNYINPSFFNFLYIESLTFFDNSSASFSVTLDIIIFLNTSDHLTSGNLSIFSFTFSDIDKVIVAIFNLQPNYVYKRKYVDIYKTFDFKKNLLILSSKTLVFFILTYLMYNYYKKRRLRNLNK